MDKKEQRFYDQITKEATSKMDFNEVANKVDYSQYKKEKKPFRFPKRLIISLATTTLAACLILIFIFLPKDSNNLIPTINMGGDGNYEIYDGFIKDYYESNIEKGPSYDMSGPLPGSPLIDDYFSIKVETSSSGSNLGMGRIKYIYEVEYQEPEKEEYYACYIERNLAQNIYEENKKILDTSKTAPLDIVNGRIVDWFYSNRYYDETKVQWCKFESSAHIYSEISGYACVGVFTSQQRIINREILTNQALDIEEEVPVALYFENKGEKYLIPKAFKLNNRTTWYASNTLINKDDTNMLFNPLYNNEFDCEINILSNTIKLRTYAVQNEEELKKIYNQWLNDYYILSNSVIVENNNPNKKLEEATYITYKYNELVEILQSFKK